MSADNVRDNTSAAHTGNRKPSMEIRYRLADNLRRYRTYRGYTQEDLAKISGLHRAYASHIEQATVNITLANLEALATGLLCGEDELLRRQLLLPRFR